MFNFIHLMKYQGWKFRIDKRKNLFRYAKLNYSNLLAYNLVKWINWWRIILPSHEICILSPGSKAKHNPMKNSKGNEFAGPFLNQCLGLNMEPRWHWSHIHVGCRWRLWTHPGLFRPLSSFWYPQPLYYSVSQLNRN